MTLKPNIFDGIAPEFLAKFQALLVACEKDGIIMKPDFGMRTPQVQAALWRQSRSEQITYLTVGRLRAENAPFLAKCLEDAGEQKIRLWATNALPGHSWHQYGLAMDCVWIRQGLIEWNADRDGNQNGYKMYVAHAQAIGLTSLYKLGDWGHVQLPSASSPLQAHTIVEIDAIMKEKYG